MIQNTPHHIQMLLKEYSQRKEANPRYSMRAFARYLGMSSPTLSRVLSNTQDISLTDCKKILKKLDFTEQESIVFVRSVAEQKCNRTYKVLSTTLNHGDLFPHEKNLLFVSNLQHQCIYLNDVAARIHEQSLEQDMKDVLAKIGFSEEVVKFVNQCLDKVVTKGEAIKHHLPLETNVGKLVIESLFSPLLGKSGEVKAVASVLLNLNLDVLKQSIVSKN